MQGPHRSLAALAALVIAGLGTASCAASTGAGEDGSLRVVAAFYPLEFVASRVGGEHVSVAGLAPPGVEAHDLELTPRQVAELAAADLVVYLSEFQPAVDEAVAGHAGDAAFDLAAAVPLLAGTEDDHDDEAEHEGGEPEGGHEGSDRHVWLDPVRMATFAGELAAALGERDPAHAAAYAASAEALGQDLATLDQEYAGGLADCQRREIVVSHAAFGYLAERYDLRQIAITGLSPEGEPSPHQLAGVIHEAERTGATTIFFETLVSPEIAERIADQVGGTTAVLDPIEGLTGGGDQDYLSLMRDNLASLRQGLGCS